jgi:hypothetical protein
MNLFPIADRFVDFADLVLINFFLVLLTDHILSFNKDEYGKKLSEIYSEIQCLMKWIN